MYYPNKNQKEKFSNEFKKEFALLSDEELINRFNKLSKNINKRRFSYGISMSVYMNEIHNELNNRFDVSDIANNSYISFKDEIKILNKKIMKC